MRRGDWPVPHFYLPRSALIVPGTRWWALPCPLCPSMSPKSSVSGVVRVHPCARVCARGTSPVLSLCCVGRWRLACFYSLCVSPCLFLFPLILIALCHQPKLSSLRSARRLVVFTSYPSTVRCRLCPSVGTSGLGRLPQARSSRACPPVGLFSVFGLAGRQDQGWVGRPPALHVPVA